MTSKDKFNVSRNNNTKDYATRLPLKQQNDYKDCLSCRLIGATTFGGLGAFTIYQSYTNPLMKRGYRYGLEYEHLLLNQTTEDDDKLYFTYQQQGYLGIQASTLNGTLHIRYPTNLPLLAKKIDIVFSGRSYVQWNEGTIINYAEKKYFEYTCRVYDGDELGISYLDLPFEFKIPENAHSSILPVTSKLTNHLGKAKIYYSIKAIITKEKRNEHLFKLKVPNKVVEIKCPITRFIRQQELEKQESITLTKNVNSGDYFITFNKGTFNQYDIIKISLNIKNINRNIIRNVNKAKIQINLNEYCKLKVGYKSHLVEKRLLHSVMNEELEKPYKGFGFNIEFFKEYNLYLSESKICCSVKTDLINVWHVVEIIVSLNGKKRVKFEKIISIVNAIDKI
ncbi:712_t:CDS:2 [Funneliformis geosporum]|uniref:20066_t:CDS:1 n=1 Tax=Funneliformis geosporum TaxID=1117311 RepID=A0A9W4SCG4_9GLOM|nr:712_t:CDS:2 [Funneliformis geosporum]CAI2163315.1 20066_t:CDS:2 [Funneliformis geosporum]